MLQALWCQIWTLAVTIRSADVAISCMVAFFLYVSCLEWPRSRATLFHCIEIEDEGQVLLGKYEQSQSVIAIIMSCMSHIGKLI